MNLWKKSREHLRLSVQIVFTAVSNGYLLGFQKGGIYQGSSKRFCVPGLNCYSCPGAVGSCPIGSLQAVLNSKNFNISFYLLGFFMIIGALLGRFVCGWLCPFGLVQDLLHKIPFGKKIEKVPFDKQLRYLKYIILLVFVIGLPLLVTNYAGYGDPWFCKYICPSGTLTAGIPLVLHNAALQEAVGALFFWKVTLLLLTIYAAIKVYRPFCKYLCPLGAIYGLFNRFSLYRLEVDPERCTSCGRCAKQCAMGVNVFTNPNSAECIRCGKCIDQCPQGAIHSVFGR